MIIVKMIGGLGNQMFQYALYKKMQVLNKEVYLDITDCNTRNEHNGYELEKVFDINANIATIDQVKELADIGEKITNKIKRKLFKKKTHYIQKKLKDDLRILDSDNLYLDGFWQWDGYFKDIRKELISDFQFNINDINEINKRTLNLINSSNSVSIHIRRGDYLNHKLYKGICEKDYYLKAINYLNENCKDELKFFVFSNDIEWVKNNLEIRNVVYVEGNNNENSYLDMFLMSRCKHNIIANSTFSWWGAWLNTNKNKIVVAPSKWLNDSSMDSNNIVLKEWIRV